MISSIYDLAEAKKPERILSMSTRRFEQNCEGRMAFCVLIARTRIRFLDILGTDMHLIQRFLEIYGESSAQGNTFQDIAYSGQWLPVRLGDFFQPPKVTAGADSTIFLFDYD